MSESPPQSSQADADKIAATNQFIAHAEDNRRKSQERLHDIVDVGQSKNMDPYTMVEHELKQIDSEKVIPAQEQERLSEVEKDFDVKDDTLDAEMEQAMNLAA